ncbi:type II 3-dehydroquinate dehydratase [Donghicola sp. C2-DW-16]|uniref:3-dehydroquinate dehydratase n=1 Tax=Donghicola mangrovi TaxID=2729614 RepID=A0A850Q8Q5_9RHOB|nr:type II 3-dehydroquinate dehydratase [Donghicola mangrovi]NVO23358.1 type II 3-dehydroquinate dehydratase [Donghicola mangrovi]NVO27184.1 type II 3-dehydroquinate dehydratase [Donghicola mangrovi]
MAKPIFVLNGPNLNMLGTRQPEVYGYDTLADVEAKCRAVAADYGFEVVFAQSNHEGEIVELIQRARLEACGIVINPAAYTHTSVAIRDALVTCDMPKFEVHISNVHAREAFRHHSYVSDIATAVIAGLGIEGYLAAIRRLVQLV